MSTTVGNGLTVDGTVKASQATQAGEAVVLGDDGMIPASLIGGSGMNVIHFTKVKDFITAIRNGEIPDYAEAIVHDRYFAIKIKCLVLDILIPIEGCQKNSTSYFAVVGGIIKSSNNSIEFYYASNTNSFTGDASITVFWSG